MNTVSIVVPSYNERNNVKNLVDQIDAALLGISHEIIFVDDSTDDTPAVLAALSAEHPHVRYERIVEIPYAFAQRTAGESKLDSKVTVQYLQQCLGLMRRAVRNPHVTVTRLSTAETNALVEQYCPAEETAV